MICVSGNEFYTWNPRLDIRTAVQVFAEYTHLQFGLTKATLPETEPSWWCVQRTARANLSLSPTTSLPGGNIPDIELTNLRTISPSSGYVFCGRGDFGRIRPILASAVRLRIESFWKI
jgi:hypothetical protein